MTDWDQRLLCPDGGCVGLIGADGTCKVCGKTAPNWGDERRRGLVADAAVDEEDDEEVDEEDDEEVDEEDDEEDDDEEDDEDDDLAGTQNEDGDDGDDDGDDDDEDEDEDEDHDAGDDGDDDDDDDSEDDGDQAEGDEDGAIATKSGESGADRAMKSAGAWTERALCPDGGCIGVIGPNGTCKVCGKSPA